MTTLPLAGVKIADFSWVGAGPRATKDMADLGADVIKIESRKRLDLGRLSPPFAGGTRDPDASTFFAITNTSKRGVTINLTDPRGVEVAKKLVAWADIVVENFSFGYMDRIGLGYDVLKAIKPDIIFVSVSVAGRKGPLGPMRGYGNSAAALSGLAHLSGWPDRDPHMPPFAYGDVVAPMFATVAMLAALDYRRVTGEGQHIDISQVEPLVHVIADQLHAQEKPGNRSPHYVPHGAFPARGVDQWIAIAVRDDAEWAKLADVAGIAGTRFTTVAGRKRHEDDLEATLATFTRRHDKRTLADKLAALGIPAEPVNDGRDVWRDPELTERGHFREITHDKLGTCDMPAPPLRFSDSAIRVGPPPNLGQHNHDIFVDLLGLSEAEVDALTQAGALA
ncbi:CaiB/BaiF CoA transferase family protein [Sphingomonas turrisvirgatae]|uniref:Succinyl-CoA--benzylsuccinate CoA-transferase n=1 Tax=Sphingomonas turrisvirgatae TaxID=1888892 RepID=A0A1E3LVJ6_9SPHN|nr:CoA transferase [Sphingomonas turrisvirgatae]ODP37763.1 succinyl-CoA--benzylsuccinate CoA-transferase [Sphingomonas turrisvirgatae]